jgi:uncharacterized protein YgiM (DUF1202 family)
MIWSGLAKLLLGLILAISLLIGGGVALALYLRYTVIARPPKPVFANDTMIKAKRSPDSTTAKRPTVSAAKFSPTPTPSKAPSPKPLEPGTYQARVTWSEGLLLRSEPNLDAERVGGVSYNQQVVVLEESADKIWQRIRLEDSQQEGWIKAGNTKRIEPEE